MGFLFGESSNVSQHTTNPGSLADNQYTINFINAHDDNSTRIDEDYRGSDGEMPLMPSTRSAGYQREDHTGVTGPPPPYRPRFGPLQVPSTGGTVTDLNSFNTENTHINDVFNNNSQNFYKGGVPPDNNRKQHNEPNWMLGPDQGVIPSTGGPLGSGQFKAPVQVPFQATFPHQMGVGGPPSPHMSVTGANIQQLDENMAQNIERWVKSTISQTQSMVAGNSGGNYDPQVPCSSSSSNVEGSDSMNNRMANLSLIDFQHRTPTHRSPPTSFSSDPQIGLKPIDQMGFSNSSTSSPYNNNFLSVPTETPPYGNNPNRHPPPGSISPFNFPPSSSGGPNFNTYYGDVTKHDHSVHHTNINNDNSFFNITEKCSGYREEDHFGPSPQRPKFSPPSTVPFQAAFPPQMRAGGPPGPHMSANVKSASGKFSSRLTKKITQLKTRKRPTQADEDEESHADESVMTAQNLAALIKSPGEAKSSESTEPSVVAAIAQRVNPASPASDRTNLKMVTPPSPTLKPFSVKLELPPLLFLEQNIRNRVPPQLVQQVFMSPHEQSIGNRVLPPTSVQQVSKSPHDGKQSIEELGSPPALVEDLPPNESAGVSWSQSCHCITAETALVHVLNFETQLLAAFTDVGFGGEYRIQVGFNQSALHAGMLVEEISLFLDEDLQVSEDDACITFSAVFAPFPGVVYAPKQAYSIPVDLPIGDVLRTLQGPVAKTRATAASANSGSTGSGEASRGVEANSTHSGHAANNNKTMTNEKHRARGGGSGGPDSDDDDSDDSPHGSPKVPGGDLPEGAGDQPGVRRLNINFSSTLSITIMMERTASHELQTASRVSIEINENYRGNDHPPNSEWFGPWLHVKMTTLRFASASILINDRPAYAMSLAQVQIAACSPSEIELSSQEPKNMHFRGNSAKQIDSRSKLIDTKFTAAANPNATLGYSAGVGSSTERTLGEWDVSTSTLTTSDALHLKTCRNDSSAGAWWRYIHNDALCDHIPNANFQNDLCPSAFFTLEEVSARTKVEVKVSVFWVNRPQAQAGQSVWKFLKRSEKTRMPIFSNFVYQVKVTLELEKVRDGSSWSVIKNATDQLKMQALKDPEPIHFDGIASVAKTRNKAMKTVPTDTQILMTSAIQGKAELTTAEKAGGAPIKIREPPAASEPSTSGLQTPSLTPSPEIPEIPEIQQARVERTDAQDKDTVITDVKSIALAPSDM